MLAMLLVAAKLRAADVVTPRPATPDDARPPTGFGATKFGMSLAEVWRLYPKAELLGQTEQLGASSVGGPYVDRLALRKQAVVGLDQPTTVELRFWKNQLWTVIVYFGDNDLEHSRAYLLKTFGPPQGTDPNSPTWPGATVTTSATVKQRWYGTSDNGLLKEAAAWFADVLTGKWKDASPAEKAEREQRMAALTPRAAQTPADKK